MTGIGVLLVLRDFDELRSTFFGEHKFLTRISQTLFVAGWRNLAWLGIWPINT